MKKVFITGGTGSVGRVFVKRFSAEGYDVLFQYHSHRQIADEIAAESGARPYHGDYIADRAVLPETGIEILINCAAINISSSQAADVTDVEWASTMAVNLHAPFALIREALPAMERRGFGRIINVGSIYSLRAVERNLPYTVSKHGLSAITKTVAREYGARGITSNEICPGPIRSRLMNEVAQRKAATVHVKPEDYLEQLSRSIPTHRLAEADDVSSVALFLASDGAGYVNGISLVVDGGMTI